MFCSSCVAILDRAQVWAILELYPKTGIHSISVRTLSSLHLLFQGVCVCVGGWVGVRGVCMLYVCVCVGVWCVCVQVWVGGLVHSPFDLTECSKLPVESQLLSIVAMGVIQHVHTL